MENSTFLFLFVFLFLILIFVLWLFFGGGDYESTGLNFLLAPHQSQSIDKTHESFYIEETIYSKDKSKEFSEKSKEISQKPPIKYRLPELNIDYYNSKTLNNYDYIKKMESKKTSSESRGECICRKILETFYEQPFPTCRPDFLINPETGSNLELDCFNAELNLALEYNGIQHYVYPNKFHRTLDEFNEQRRRDYMKKEVCESAGIYLINVPYNIPYHKLPKYIEYYLPENVKYRIDNNIEDGDWDV